MPSRLIRILLALLAPAAARAEADAPVALGLAHVEAAQHDAEYPTNTPAVAVYRERGVELSLIEWQQFYAYDQTEDELLASLRRFHVVHLPTTFESPALQRFKPELEKRGPVVGAALKRYVEEGGGLFLQPQPVRYPNTDDIKYWNLVLAPLGLRITGEGLFDETHSYTGRTLFTASFWWTTNIVAHPATEGVSTLYLPMNGAGVYPGVTGIEFGEGWEVVARGLPEARTYGCDSDNVLRLTLPGSVTSAPPVAAVRALGGGRVFVLPVSELFTGMNFNRPRWLNTVETEGDPASGRRSDLQRLQINAYRWLAETARANPALGAHRRPAYEPVAFPESVEYESATFEKAPARLRGIYGARSSYGGGEGTVAEYVAAAKAAGLAMIVFADPLENLTPETLAKLKADCIAASDESFYACPGVEFTDRTGLRWYLWGDKTEFPVSSFESNGRTYPQWDGSRVLHFGHYASQCAFQGIALVDYSQLAANNLHAENMWWFFHYLPFVYDGGRLAADNLPALFHGLADLRWPSLATLTRIRAPGEVAAAAETCFVGFNSLATAREVQNNWVSQTWTSLDAGLFVSQGPVVETWHVINRQLEDNWRFTRGAQRARASFRVRSDAGIAEVRVHDTDRGLVRRFDGAGARELAREFEMVHDRQRWLTLEVVDVNGQRAISQPYPVYSYKGDLFRCGDNLNILCSLGLIWHPDRNEMLHMFRPFAQGSDVALHGWDTGTPLAPMPDARGPDHIVLKDIGVYPTPENATGMVGKLMEQPILSSYGFNIASMRLGHLAERFDNAERPTPAMGSVPRDLGPHPYIERTHTIYNPLDRLDFYVIWNHRRGREGRQNYRGGVMWHEGEIRFKQDVILSGAVPIPLLRVTTPFDPEQRWGNTAMLDIETIGLQVDIAGEAKPAKYRAGRVRPGGFVAHLSTLVGHLAFLAPEGSDFAYSSTLPGELMVGLGRDGQEVKAGTVWSYRFAVGTFVDQADPVGDFNRVSSGFNLGGGTNGYPIEMRTGQLDGSMFFCDVRAEDGRAAFRAGPQTLPIDLPIRVSGLADNGCVAVHSTARPWFRFVPMMDGRAYVQEPIDDANDIWIGNVFVCDDPEVKFTLVADGRLPDQPPFLEAHNPGVAAKRVTLRSPADTPRFGGLSVEVDLPAGHSVRFAIDEAARTISAESAPAGG